MIKLENENLIVEIAKKGAEIKSVRNTTTEYMFDADPKYWGRTAPVLFPIVGSLNENKFSVDSNEYEMTQHGFARDMEFDVLEHKNDYVSLILSSNEETLKKYPFEFSFIIDYKLFDNKLEVSYKVTNNSESDMYYQVGAHPAFSIDPNEEYYIKFSIPEYKYNLEEGKISSKQESVDNYFKYENSLFDNDALIYKFSEPENYVEILKGSEKYIRIDFKDMPLLGIWTPIKKNAPFICLEPWNGLADFKNREGNEFSQKEYINKLDIDESEIVSYTITFS